MGEDQILTAIGNLDSRATRIEQFLPRLATRTEMREALTETVAPLATREEMYEAIAAAVAPLAMREELALAIAPLTTREELALAIAPLATREELAGAVAPLATREEMERGFLNLRSELHDDIERLRRRADALIEDLRDDNRLILEHLLALSARVDALARR